MALFKIFKGADKDLPTTKHEGYAYFTTDKGMLYIDISDDTRVQVNGKYATGLIVEEEEVGADQFLQISDIIDVSQGGTGLQTLTKNGILIGQGTENVKLIVIPDGNFVVGSTANGLASLEPSAALEKLNAYNKATVDQKVAGATTLAYNVTLKKGEAWVKSGDFYEQKYPQTALKCGANGNVPPLVTFVTNQEEYSKIDHAEATISEGITFYCKEQPKDDIQIIVIDQM